MYFILAFVGACVAIQRPDVALWATGGYVALLVLQRRR